MAKMWIQKGSGYSWWLSCWMWLCTRETCPVTVHGMISSFGSAGTVGVYYPENSVSSSSPMQLPWTWLDSSFQQNQHKVPLTQICLLWVFVEASNFTLQIIILSHFTWILAKNTRLAQPAAVGSFLERRSCHGIKNGEKVQAPPDSSSALVSVIPGLVGHCPCGICSNSCFCTQWTLPMWAIVLTRANSGVWFQWSSKATSFPGLCTAKAVHPMRNPFQLFPGFYLAAAARSTFIPPVWTAAHFPRCKKHVHVLSKLQNHLPGLLQPRNPYHLLNHFYEWGEKIKLTSKK